MTSLPTRVLVISTYRHSTWTPAYLPCSANAGSMQPQCNSLGGLCEHSANTVQPQCKSLNTALAARLVLLPADAEVLAGLRSVRPGTAVIALS